MDEKIYLTERDHDSSLWPAMMMCGGANNQWNNPFIYLVWMMYAQRMWGNNGWNENGNCGYNTLQGQISSLQNQMQDNHNSDLILQGIHGNENAIREASTRIGCDLNVLQQSICDVRGGIDKLSGQVGFSAERVINAVNMGDCNVIQALKDCCCATQKLILEQGYQNQLAQKDQMFATQVGFDRTNTGLERGFSAVAFQAQQDKCDIIRSSQDNTQRIIDTLNNHWKDEQALQIQDLKFQLSQERQNRYLASLTGGCGCNTGCGGCGGNC